MSISVNVSSFRIMILQSFLRDERKWRKWVDDVLVHVLSPNVYRTMDESFQAFEWFSKVRCSLTPIPQRDYSPSGYKTTILHYITLTPSLYEE